MGLYKLYEQRVWPRISAALNNDEALGEERKKTVQRAQGVVLEIGFGMGPNLAHYDPQKVQKLYGLEPSQGMRDYARRTLTEVQPRFEFEFLDLPGEHIPLADNSVDTVVSTFTFCTIDDLDAALHGIARVLKPGGTLLFWEHGLAEDSNPKAQREHFDFTGMWRWMAAAGYLYRGEAQVSDKSNEASAQ